jgi:hypothetical protein
VIAAGAGFLLAVVWFDLMFDIQARGHGDPVLPSSVRDSIAGYYARVTTAARPMNRLIALVMVGTLAAHVGEIVRNDIAQWRSITSFVCLFAAVGLAASRTVRNAVRLGTQADDDETQSRLARSILRDHVVVAALLAVVLTLQLSPGS